MQAQAATVRCYPFDSVYPGRGKELQLEQVRALLPKYAPKPGVQTTVCCYPKDSVYSPSGELQLEQIRAMLPQYQPSYDCDMEMTEVSTANITVFGSSNGVDEQLKKLMCVDEAVVSNPPTTAVSTFECEGGLEGGFEQELCRLMEQDSSKVSLQQNKENEQCYTGGSGKYAFSPDDVEGVPSWPCRADLVHTKLNFTDTESMLSVSGHCGNASLQKPSNVIDGFNVASNLEYKAKRLHSQQELEEEFAVTEIGKPIGRKPLQELHPSQQGSQIPHASFGVYEGTFDESSFLPFHDSMQTSSSFRKPNDKSSIAVGHESMQTKVVQPSQRELLCSEGGKPMNRKPLVELYPLQRDSQHLLASFEGTFDESSFLPFHDSIHKTSFRKPCNMSSLAESRKAVGRKPLQELCPSHPPQASFGVYEGTFDESSFMPYHDSMHASCENPRIIQDGSPRQYSAPLGAPIVHCDQQAAVCEQTFTQFDIAHPKSIDSVSTPRTVSFRQDLSMDLSVIPCDVENVRENQMHAQASRPGILTPIKEESSTSSKSSSRFTTSSNSSGNSCQSVCSTTDQECNPFLPDIVNRMLNSVGGIPEDTAVPVFTCTTPAPTITPGHILPGQVFHSTSLLTKSRFSDIYLVQGTFGKKVLQVYDVTIPLEWEVTILNQLQHRLEKLGLQELSEVFQEYGQVYQFTTSFITLSMYYSLGSIQNVIEKFDKKIIPESVVSYLTLEMFAIIGYLHQCGIIHAAVKPAHFLLCDTRTNLPARRGLGLRLIDFRAAIDTRQFPDDQMFTGTPPHLDAVVMDGQPWKWQLDYCGLAMCVISLISNRSGVLVMKRDASSGLYSCSKRLYKKYDTPEWQGLVKKLLNANEVLPLHQLGEFLERKNNPKELIRFF